MAPGVNFTNVLLAAFTNADPKSAIKLLNLTIFFALLGSSHVKAACRMLVKLNPGLTHVSYSLLLLYFTNGLSRDQDPDRGSSSRKVCLNVHREEKTSSETKKPSSKLSVVIVAMEGTPHGANRLFPPQEFV